MFVIWAFTLHYSPRSQQLPLELSIYITTHTHSISPCKHRQMPHRVTCIRSHTLQLLGRAFFCEESWGVSNWSRSHCWRCKWWTTSTWITLITIWTLELLLSVFVLYMFVLSTHLFYIVFDLILGWSLYWFPLCPNSKENHIKDNTSLCICCDKWPPTSFLKTLSKHWYNIKSSTHL